ncbi:MAG TPA: ATP-binding protein [Verrucomicrobiae bacterium]|jgi:signal transduction histidine kinase
MTIRARLTLWYGSILFCAVAVIGVLSYSELLERRERIHRTDHGMVEILEIMLGIGAPAAILSVAGGWWLTRKSLTPLAALTLAAERITENTLAEQLPRSQNGDELDRLTDVFNGMTTRLNDSFHRIREFTLHASHELKTPLTVLCGEMELELRNEGLSESARERCASQLDELRRLSRIVDALTLLARADAGLFDLKFEPLELSEIIQDNFADAQILARAQGIHVELTACEKARVMGNKHRLRQLFLNLTDNAVKYNEQAGRIIMTLRTSGLIAEFVMTNTGPGITPEALPRVFDRFFRGDPAHSNIVEGSGLGLSIAQWIVTAHGGTIQIESVPGKMTTVAVKLPLKPE